MRLLAEATCLGEDERGPETNAGALRQVCWTACLALDFLLKMHVESSALGLSMKMVSKAGMSYMSFSRVISLLIASVRQGDIFAVIVHFIAKM
jgi:hypothetical protein